MIYCWIKRIGMMIVINGDEALLGDIMMEAVSARLLYLGNLTFTFKVTREVQKI